MHQSPIELERILAQEHKVDQLHNHQLIEEHSDRNGHNKPHQLSHHQRQVLDAQDLTSYHTTYADRGQPHDTADHPHDHFEDGREEVDHHLALAADRSQERAEDQTKEDNAQGVGALTVLDDTDHLRYERLSSVQKIGIIGDCVVDGKYVGVGHVDSVCLLECGLEEVVGEDISAKTKIFII